MAQIGFLGDAHGDFNAVFSIIDGNPGVDRWFQVGDLGGELDNYPSFPTNFHFIQGNHENWDYLQSLKETDNPMFLKNGTITQYESGERSYLVGALGGNYSAKHYTKKTVDLCGNRRRHYTEEEYKLLINRYEAIGESLNVDVLITHEAPSPFYKHLLDIGIPKITEVIETIKPGIHFFGHHHMFKVLDISGVISVGLDYAHKSFVLYDIVDKNIRKIDI